VCNHCYDKGDNGEYISVVWEDNTEEQTGAISSLLRLLPVYFLTRKPLGGLERGPLSLVSTTEELLDRKVAAPV
jgi:hypothetical protein